MAGFRKRPLDYRRETLQFAADAWRVPASFSIVGVSSSGKTNALQHMCDPDVQRHYLPQQPLATIVVDANSLGPLATADASDEGLRAWAGYELMMHRLFLAFFPFPMLTQDEAERMYSAYQAIQDGHNVLVSHLALRYLELSIDLFARKGYTLVFLFDEFELFLRHLPVRFFQTLRGIRDQNKLALAYATFSRAPLPELVRRNQIAPLDIESFIELFTDRTHYLGAFNEVDAYSFIQDIAQRKKIAVTPARIQELLVLTGRFAGLMRSSLNALPSMPAGAELADYLAHRPAIREEARSLWMSLNEHEHAVLMTIARHKPFQRTEESEQAVNTLLQKQMLRLTEDGQRLEIIPPLFARYLASQPT
jgi:hypothetical protein